MDSILPQSIVIFGKLKWYFKEPFSSLTCIVIPFSIVLYIAKTLKTEA